MVISAKTDARRRTDNIQFRLIYLATLPAFLVSALLARTVPIRRAGQLRSKLTLLAEAKAAASTCGSFALMG